MLSLYKQATVERDLGLTSTLYSKNRRFEIHIGQVSLLGKLAVDLVVRPICYSVHRRNGFV